MQIGSRQFDIGSRTFIVGILNVTPDSFSDGGAYRTTEQAVRRAKQMVEEGADIIEIGGESSRPGHVQIGAREELDRVVPVLLKLRDEVDVPISVDTYKSVVAGVVLENGAAMINDVHRFKQDAELAAVCAKYGAACCVMHNRDHMDYGNFLQDVIEDLQESVDLLTRAGIDSDKILIDPGVGFAKTVGHNLEILRNLPLFTALPYPVMLGTSRKSFMERTLGLAVDERVEATIATTVLGIRDGCDFIRVHDVLQNKRAAMMADEILRHRY